jgi:hypothetical protein
MKFEIDFNDPNITNDDFLINTLGGKLEPTGATKYGPFERVMIEVKDFDELKEILDKVDKEFKVISSAVVSYDPPTIYIEIN